MANLKKEVPLKILLILVIFLVPDIIVNFLNLEASKEAYIIMNFSVAPVVVIIVNLAYVIKKKFQ